MKRLHFVHAFLTVLLLGTVSAFGFLLVTNVLEVRFKSSAPPAEPIRTVEMCSAKARLLVIRGLRPSWASSARGSTPTAQSLARFSSEAARSRVCARPGNGLGRTRLRRRQGISRANDARVRRQAGT